MNDKTCLVFLHVALRTSIQLGFLLPSVSPASNNWADFRHWLIQLSVYEEEIEVGRVCPRRSRGGSSVVEQMYDVVSGLI